jgi:microcystin-dependent protein
VPDLRGRTVAGKDNMGGSAANRITNAGAGFVGTTLGATGGTQTHALTSAENGTHDHAVGTLTNSTSSVSGTVTASSSSVSGTISATQATGTTNSESNDHTHSGSTNSNTTGMLVNAGNAGGAGQTLDGNYANNGSTITVNILNDPGHTHTITTGGISANHNHTFTAGVQTITHTLVAAAQSIIHSLTAAAQTISGSTASSGSGTAHQNTQPTIILNYIIKA